MGFWHVSPLKCLCFNVCVCVCVCVCVWRVCADWLLCIYSKEGFMSHTKWSGAQKQQNSTVCLCHTALCLQSVSIAPLIHLLSSRWLSPHHPSIHLLSFNDSLCFPPHCLLSLPLMSQIQIWGSLIPHSLGHCGLVWRGVIRGWEDGGKASEWKARVFSEAEAGCKMQKQRRTSRLKKHAWMPLKRLLCCRLVSSLWLRASRACQGTTVESISVICSLSCG